MNIQRGLYLGQRFSNSILQSRKMMCSTATNANSLNIETKQKIQPELMQSVLTPELKQLAEMFRIHNYELRLAGGAVRDLISGKTPHDIDFATDATPTEMKEMFHKLGVRLINTNGESHGTITARINDKENFEITTLRIDKVTDGRHAEVEFTKDWQIDSERRDLTINSMFLDLEGCIYDYFNGAEDLRQRRILFVKDPKKRIQEDYLRILRYFRFYGRYADSPDNHNPPVLEAIANNSSGLINISGERIWTELKMILTGRYAASIMKKMYETGCLAHIGLSHVGDSQLQELEIVCERSEGLNPDPSTRLAALTSTVDDVQITLKRLRFSNDELSVMLFIADQRQELLCGSHSYSEFEDKFLMSAADKRIRKSICEALKYLGRGEEAERFDAWIPPRFPVNGHAIKSLGLKGRAVGEALQQLKEKWKQSNYMATEAELLSEENLKQLKIK